MEDVQLKKIKFQIMQQSGNTSIVFQVAILMDNDTQGILFNVKKDDFEFPYHIKIILSTFIVVILISQYVLQRRLFMFLRRPNRRFIDRIVDFQLSVNYFVVIFCMVWLWQYWLWTFQVRDTKLERFLAKNQLYSNEITKF